MNRKTLHELDVELKALTDRAGEPTGEVTFYAAVFNNVDLIGDRVLPGAFTNSLAKWRTSGDPIPVVFAHSWNDPTHIIGSADPNDVHEDRKGLFVKALLDIADNPTAKTVFGQIQRRVVKEASFAYDVVKEAKARDGANNLVELSIIEVGPCLKGMNPEAGGFSTKSSDLQRLFAAVDDLEAVVHPHPTRREADGIIHELDRRIKSGARNSRADAALIQEIHNRCAALGATCGDEPEIKSAAQTKAEIELLELEASVIAA